MIVTFGRDRLRCFIPLGKNRILFEISLKTYHSKTRDNLHLRNSIDRTRGCTTGLSEGHLFVCLFVRVN